jgi:hypothetical protein
MNDSLTKSLFFAGKSCKYSNFCNQCDILPFKTSCIKKLVLPHLCLSIPVQDLWYHSSPRVDYTRKWGRLKFKII